MKKLLLAIGFVLMILLILGFIAPKQYILERTIEIAAPKSHVYEFMNSLEKVHSWSAPSSEDSTVLLNYHGTSGTVGSYATWKGSNGLTRGKETITKVVPFNRVETEIRHLRPWESLNQATISVSGRDDTCTVTWHFDGHSPFPFNIRHLFTDMDRVLGPTYEKSLQRLKLTAERTYIESATQMTKSSGESMRFTFIPQNALHSLDAVSMNSLLEEVKKMLNIKDLHPVITPIRLRFGPNGPDSMGVRLPSDTTIGDISWHQLESDLSLTAVSQGGYSELADVHHALRRYLTLENLDYDYPTAEIFVKGPFNEQDSSKWQTLVRYRLRNPN